jgi:hypothetical protein
MKNKVLIFILLAIFLTSCTQLGGFFGQGGGNVGGKGVVLKFIDAPSNGEVFGENLPFNIVIQLENYVTTSPLIGELCLRDDLGDNYGGITTEECKQLNIPQAAETTNQITPSIDQFQFGPYTYKNLLKELSLGTKITADVKYEVDAVAAGTTCIKRSSAESQSIPSNCGQSQSIQLKQPDLPLKVTKLTTKASSLSATESLVSMEITLSKSTQGRLLSKENLLDRNVQAIASIIFSVELNGQQVKCTNANDKLDFRQNENEKLIKCTARIPLEQDYIQAPITIKMGYGFIQSVDGPTIQLKKEEEILA